MDDNPIIIGMLQDQHRETMSRITVLEGKVESSRLEIKSDLVAERLTVRAEMVAHNEEDERRFAEINSALVDLKTWRAKAVAYGTVGMFVLTFVSQAIASGSFLSFK